jgi:hypothetical protein
MKIISFKLLTFLLLFSTDSVFGQLSLLRDGSTGMPVLANPYPDMKGTPYVGDFEFGNIIFSERDTAENLMINFNAFSNKLEYRFEGKLLELDANKIVTLEKMLAIEKVLNENPDWDAPPAPEETPE